MDKEYIGLLGVLVGSAVIYGMNYLQMRYDDKKEKRKLYSNKLEEAHKIITEIRQIYRSEFGNHLRIINNGITAASNKCEKPIPIDHIKMLIDFYAPRLRGKLEKFEKYRTEYGKMLAICLDADKLDNAKKAKLKHMLSDGSGLIEKFCGELQKEISFEARKYL